MQMIITLILMVLMYTIGYLTGYKECENIAQQDINEMIVKEYKISMYEEKES